VRLCSKAAASRRPLTLTGHARGNAPACRRSPKLGSAALAVGRAKLRFFRSAAARPGGRYLRFFVSFLWGGALPGPPLAESGQKLDTRSQSPGRATLLAFAPPSTLNPKFPTIDLAGVGCSVPPSGHPQLFRISSSVK